MQNSTDSKQSYDLLLKKYNQYNHDTANSVIQHSTSVSITELRSSLRKSHSMPHMSSRHDSGVGLSAAGSCSVLDQIGGPAMNQQHRNTDKVPYNTRLVADLRQLMTLRQHYYPEGGWGWLLVGIVFIVQCFSQGTHLSLGVFILIINDEFPKQNPIYACLLTALSYSMSLFFSPITIALCRRNSTRLIAVIGGLIMSLGYLFTSFASQFHQMLLSFVIIVGIGASITRDCSTIMIAQYFKKKREFVEIFIVSGTGFGIMTMSTFLKLSIDSLGWRFGLQAITVTVFITFIFGLFYRSASLYHPQRRAILHLKNQRRKIKDKNKQNLSPPFLDFKTLHSRTVQILLLSSATISFGLYVPAFHLATTIRKDGFTDGQTICLQIYMGLAWILGAIIFGIMVVRNSRECSIAKQYLCQAAAFLCGLCMLGFAGVDKSYNGFVLFVWIYGIFCGGYHYSLKVYVYERVRARNFIRAWGFVQFIQSIPIGFGIPLTGYMNENLFDESGYIIGFLFTLIGSLLMFLINLHKRNITRHKHTRSNGSQHLCVLDDCPQNRKLSFSQEPDHEPGMTLGEAAIYLNSELLIHQISGEELVDNPVQGGTCVVVGDKPELTCISEEGIADMDLPDNLFDDFDYIGDCITSCNKVENYLMLSEFENNLNAEMPDLGKDDDDQTLKFHK